MLLEEGAEEEGQVLDEVLLVILPILEGLSDVSSQRQHLHETESGKCIKLLTLLSRSQYV